MALVEIIGISQEPKTADIFKFKEHKLPFWFFYESTYGPS